MFFRFSYQFAWNTWDQTCFEFILKFVTEQDFFPFLIKAENTYPKKFIYFKSTNFDITSHLEILLVMNTRTITANRLIDHNFGEIGSN